MPAEIEVGRRRMAILILRSALAFTLLVLTGLAGAGLAFQGEPASSSAPIVLVGEDEPGQPLVVSGTVYAPDGVTPVAGITLNIHQTDANGYYARPGTDDPNPRIRGRLQTDVNGRYRFRTIKPGSYPGRTIPAHIHIKASGAGYSEQWVHDLLFEGDPLISERTRARATQAGKFGSICSPQRDPAGLLHCEYNIKLKQR